MLEKAHLEQARRHSRPRLLANMGARGRVHQLLKDLEQRQGGTQPTEVEEVGSQVNGQPSAALRPSSRVASRIQLAQHGSAALDPMVLIHVGAHVHFDEHDKVRAVSGGGQDPLT